MTTTEDDPPIGTLVRDTAIDKLGYVMGSVGPYIQLRPAAGGCEWDVRREDIEPATPTDELRARAAEATKRARWGR